MIRRYGYRVWLTILLTSLPLACMADNTPMLAQLETITVLGTRTEKAPDAVPRSIDVIGPDEIIRQQAADLGGTVDTLPNVSLDGGPRAMGETIRIRGLTNERILLLIDGVEQSYSVGHVAGSFIAPGLIESVEVERGPASVLWGSGAIGGVVSVDTKDAADLLGEGEDFGVRLHTSYQSASDGWLTSGTVYGHLSDNIDALVQFGRRSNENLELGNDTTLPNSAYQRRSLLAKGTVHLAPGNSLRVSHRRARLEGVSPTNPRQNKGSLEQREITVGASVIEWNLLPPTSQLVDLTARLSHIRTEVTENKVGAAEREDTVVDVFGLDIANTSRIDLGAANRHVLTYGVDINHSTIESSLNGQPRTLVPSGKRLMAGIFVQDEIHWNQAWTTTLGLRYDYYQSEADANQSLDHDDSALSAQAGLLWQATDWLQFYASYAEAFRAPSVSELFSNGPHYVRGYKLFNLKPNPNLQPEQAANKEVGVRTEWQSVFRANDQLKMELTVFQNDVENFIQDVCIKHCGSFRPGPPTPVLTFNNVTEARLEGFEASVSYTTETWFAGLNYGQTRGYNETKERPMGDMPADTWVMRIGLKALPWNGRVTWRVTYAESQNRVPTQATVPPAADSYVIQDLLTSWHPTPQLRVDFGISNIADSEYRRAGAYIQEAGRNIKLGLTLKF